MKNEKNVIIRLTQGINKLKCKLLLKKITNNMLCFIHYLWKIKLLYGYFIINHLKKDIFLFIKKYDFINNNYVTFSNRSFSKVHYKKIIKWSKNTLYVMKTNNTYLTLNSSSRSLLLIGGYLLLTIF